MDEITQASKRVEREEPELTAEEEAEVDAYLEHLYKQGWEDGLRRGIHICVVFYILAELFIRLVLGL